jgi:glucose-6-phosphate dehydrogenase assembly protein OpcA
MTTRQDEISASWQGEDVDPAKVERALARLIQEMNPPGEDGDFHPPARASVLSLIVRSPDGYDEVRAIEALGELADLHPSRTLVVAVDPAAKPGLDASVRARCQLKPGSRARVCFEEVRLTARGVMCGQVASVVAPLLIPDLPVFLWWLGSQPEPEEELLPLCDRLIVDSRSLGNDGILRLEQLVGILAGRAVVGDLAWSALEPWRELLTQLFDPVEARPYQQRLTAVRIYYAAGEQTAQALLLLGWLAACLGWPLEAPIRSTAGNAHRLEIVGPAGPLEVSFSPVQSPGGGFESGELLALNLVAQQGVRDATFAVEREEDTVCAAVRTVLPGRPISAHTLPLTRPPLAALLSRELEQMARNPLYLESLAWAGKIARESKV